ncbi:Fibulin-2 [Holothuria leucospilota]|uniref:Fibulin-2 n=1 Tax=Holothuria leucospilota TaxID=206669 RepID=A0A9Q1C7E2_HOLLE|nr:Fibulin-2 [Holothuria leucospilota]
MMGNRISAHQEFKFSWGIPKPPPWLRAFTARSTGFGRRCVCPLSQNPESAPGEGYSMTGHLASYTCKVEISLLSIPSTATTTTTTTRLTTDASTDLQSTQGRTTSTQTTFFTDLTDTSGSTSTPTTVNTDQTDTAATTTTTTRLTTDASTDLQSTQGRTTLTQTTLFTEPTDTSGLTTSTLTTSSTDHTDTAGLTTLPPTTLYTDLTYISGLTTFLGTTFPQNTAPSTEPPEPPGETTEEDQTTTVEVTTGAVPTTDVEPTTEEGETTTDGRDLIYTTRDLPDTTRDLPDTTQDATTTRVGFCQDTVPLIHGNCYVIIEQAGGVSFEEAQSLCRGLDGELAKITPTVLDSRLETLFDPNGIQDSWIGLRRDSLDIYRWIIDNMPSEVSDWDMNEPTFECAYISFANEGKWRTDQCATARHAPLCQIPEENFELSIAAKFVPGDEQLPCEQDNPCLGNHVTCMNNSTRAVCICDVGYRFTDTTETSCIDINECEEGSHGCDSRLYLVCFNMDGSYSCECEEGYTRDSQGVCERSRSLSPSAASTSKPPSKPPSQPPSAISARMALRITSINSSVAVFSNELLDKDSPRFTSMSNFVCLSVTEFLEDLPLGSLDRCSALGFRSGSIIAYLQLDMSTTRENLPLEIVQDFFILKLKETDREGYKLLESRNGNTLTIEERSIKFENIDDISCENYQCFNGGSCRLDQEIFERSCICPPSFSGAMCEGELNEGQTKIEESPKPTSAVAFILIPIAVASFALLATVCCCCMALRTRLNRKSVLYRYREPSVPIPLQGMEMGLLRHTAPFHGGKEVVRNFTARPFFTHYEDDNQDDIRLERLFSGMRSTMGQTSRSETSDEDNSISGLREIFHPYTADGSINY